MKDCGDSPEFYMEAGNHFIEYSHLSESQPRWSGSAAEISYDCKAE